MLAVDRLLQIETLFSAQAVRIVVIELDEELLHVVLYSSPEKFFPQIAQISADFLVLSAASA